MFTTQVYDEYLVLNDSISNAVANNDVDLFIELTNDLNPERIKLSIFVLPEFSYTTSPSYGLREQMERLALPTSNLTLLHIAAFCDSLDIFCYLMSVYDFSLREKSPDSYLPLHYAIYGNAKEVAYYILDNEPEQAKLETEARHQLLYFAITFDNEEFLTLLLKYGARIDSPANKKDNLINLAINKKSMSCLKILLQSGYKSKNYRYSLLMAAVMSLNINAVSLLLESGEDPDYFSPNYISALFIACTFKRFDIIKLLCNKMNVFDLPIIIREKSLIHYLCETCEPEIISYVLGYCKDKNITTIVNRFDKFGKLGPAYLVDKDYPDKIIEIFKILINYGFQINALPKDADNNYTGNSLIYYFVRAIIPNLQVIKWLLKNGADPYLKSQNGLSAYDVCKNPDIIKLLNDMYI